MTEPEAGDALWREEAEWLRIQYQMAHHDIWWVKSQQMAAGNWTLLLLGALVGVANLVGYETGDPNGQSAGHLLGALAALVVAVGAWYVWDLYATLVRSRDRAATIVRPLNHPAFDDPKRPGKRHLVFPLVITTILFVGLGILLLYFNALNVPAAVLAILVWGLLAAWGLRAGRPDAPTDGRPRERGAAPA